ncbi:MAG: hypothetical protein K0S14_3716 [Thermomicrobiales bacterium]|nr:hypothetical protein [Thermomicrobiales bacterium]
MPPGASTWPASAAGTRRGCSRSSATTPVPLPADQLVPFAPFTDVRVLGDGRVAVVGPGEMGRGDVRIFVKEDDRWLIDDWFDLS